MKNKVQTKLKAILKELGISQTRFAKTLQEKGLKSEAWGHHVVQGRQPLNLRTANTVAKLLTDMSGKSVSIEDLLAIPTQPKITSSELVPYTQGISEDTELYFDDNEEKQLWELVATAKQVQTIEVEPVPNKKTSRKKVVKKDKHFLERSVLSVGLLLTLITIAIMLTGYITQNTESQKESEASELLPPTVIGPEGVINTLTPELRVSGQESVTLYRYIITNTLNSQQVFYEESAQPLYMVTPFTPLCENIPYTWTVTAFDIDGNFHASTPMPFTIDLGINTDGATQITAEDLQLPETPKPISPEGLIIGTNVTLEVSPIEGALGYGFFVRDLTENKIVYNQYYLPESEHLLPDDLLKDGRDYRWNTQAINCAGVSSFSEPAYFNIQVQ